MGLLTRVGPLRSGATLLAASAVWIPAVLMAQTPASRAEYEVKSAYLYSFLQFTTWPPGTFEPGDPIYLCVLGHDPMGDLLPQVLGDRRVEGREIRIVPVSRLVEVNRCHAAFIAQRNSISAREWLARLRSRPVLTIGEGTGFTEEGGMVALVVVGETVRFEVNRSALRRAGVDLSSRVLRLALRVLDG